VTTALAEVISRDHDGQLDALVEVAVLGSSSPEAVADWIERLCQDRLGAPVVGGLFYRASTGLVAGVELTDLRTVVVKVHQPQWSVAFLEAMVTTQRQLAESGFPCPRPLVGPVPTGPRQALATIETLLPDPGMHSLSGSEALEISAAGLATQVASVRGLELPALGFHPLRTPTGEIYPQPHSPLFDFAATAERAVDIDELARIGSAARDADPGPPVIAHTDWSARNVRVAHGQIAAVYDWDSLALVPVSTAVGLAAATWQSTGEMDDPMALSAEDVSDYLAAYARTAARSLDATASAAAWGSALWALAYTARCELALEERTGRCLRRARDRLERQGDAFAAAARQRQT
jgi:hypothetical protein